MVVKSGTWKIEDLGTVERSNVRFTQSEKQDGV